MMEVANGLLQTIDMGLVPNVEQPGEKKALSPGTCGTREEQKTHIPGLQTES